MEGFPGGAGSGAADARPTSPAAFAGQAVFGGFFSCTTLARRELERALPAPLRLATGGGERPDHHPVLFFLGEQARGATLFAGMAIPLGISYREFGVAVPFVHAGADGPLHVYVPRMFSDRFGPTWFGNTYYGLGKRMARIGWRNGRFEVASEDGRPLAHADVEPSGRGDPDATAAFEPIRRMFSLPVLGRTEAGRFVRSWFDWDLRRSRVRAARVQVALDRELLPGLPAGAYEGLRRGSFSVDEMVWRITWPHSPGF